MSAGEEFLKLLEIMHRLRAECPWDKVQTHESLRAYLLEEAYEVLHALDRGGYDELCEELGDLMLQVVFHAEVAQEAGRFDMEDVLRGLCDKLVRRHPHVFADARADDPTEVSRRWASIKTCQEQKKSLLDGVPPELPALLQAARVLSKIRQCGPEPLEVRDPLAQARQWLDRLEKVAQAGDAAGVERAVGMVCLYAAAVAGRTHVNPEDSLRQAVHRLSDAFRREEADLRKRRTLFGQLSEDEILQIATRLLAVCEEGDK